ncbi:MULTISPECIES: protein-methionine-sulfoxide reductase catalytic subunit MsrP [unclassified Oceanobacter]|uniref:protein-methionine-sulfoxide reductase catalytic subunit MsrP n=1 Tax=unclassified Oceanobacter TaxID=2620260 RepID=UPI002734B152|nr:MULTISPECIES: protein-methionine-sulfoxide reductase catalytic subunit MsrP [unclassified Oceanobacter]MDP2608901.1 protein-methionine-sulfoxide reductase catalytic subunit MsrP [Oceanobacter sp. 1_MG-2023]MDP2612114.1 protein-methionine-sulfoxide reductase catalytic subunit MsrP [Oceanobacter sp. 2_MG-2023]
MMILKPRRSDPKPSEITPKDTYLNRRAFMGASIGTALSASAAISAATMSLPALALTTRKNPETAGPGWLQQQIGAAKESPLSTTDAPAPYSAITNYNNFYEFGYDKADPARYASKLSTDPWSVEISGACENPGVLSLETIMKDMELEERIYRLRCVEAWSMVIPWIGFSLADLIKRCKPLSSARFVEFKTLEDPKQFPEQRSRFSTIDWPYREGLRMDEAMNPLTILAVGLYGEVLPNQNGAPLRLVVPWKYGFKSIKSIVSIRFTETQPVTSWNSLAAKEYGFYANVNPEVDHPRWSQARERRLPSGLLSANRIETQMFNGYADEVAHLYRGMDLQKLY